MKLSFLTGICLILSCVLISGCQSDNEDISVSDEKSNNRIVQVEDSDPAEKQTLTNQQVADHLASVAAEVGNVNDATAIVAGPYAVVGIDVDKNLDRSRVGTIKYTVLEALQNDPYGKTAVVVADGDIMERLRQMGNNMDNGYPTQGVVNELSAIVGRYMPEFPINENRPNTTDQNKELMPKEDEKKLDEIEEDQSNHYNSE